MRGYGGIAALALLVTGCTGESSSRTEPIPTPSPSTPPAASSAPAEPGSEATSEPTAEPTSAPPDPAFSSSGTMRTVRFLAGEVGPRLATGPAFHRSARWVERRFEVLGYEVSQQSFPVPAGDSWGVPVAAGTSVNVVARPRGLGPRTPYLLVGAHLDTVAVAPGAEDNASGIAVLLETARRWSVAPGHLPVVFVAFGGEEPRGTGDLEHHFGSLHYVATMSPAERRHLRGMVSMDRVGVGERVPVASVGGTPVETRAALVRSAAGLGIGVAVDRDDKASDHESFADAGLPAARLGSTPYAAYHSAQDVPAVVDPAQLRRVGRVIWDWLLRAR
jgi:aminopeptidase YwaD